MLGPYRKIFCIYVGLSNGDSIDVLVDITNRLFC